MRLSSAQGPLASIPRFYFPQQSGPLGGLAAPSLSAADQATRDFLQRIDSHYEAGAGSGGAWGAGHAGGATGQGLGQKAFVKMMQEVRIGCGGRAKAWGSTEV